MAQSGNATSPKNVDLDSLYDCNDPQMLNVEKFPYVKLSQNLVLFDSLEDAHTACGKKVEEHIKKKRKRPWQDQYFPMDTKKDVYNLTISGLTPAPKNGQRPSGAGGIGQPGAPDEESSSDNHESNNANENEDFDESNGLPGRTIEAPVPGSIMRARYLSPKAQFAIDDRYPNSLYAHQIEQGNLNNCWFVSCVIGVINILGKKDFLYRHCRHYDTEKGIYGFVFRYHGKYVYIIIDDRLYMKNMTTCHDSGVARSNPSEHLLFGRCANPDEIWFPLLEKAFAKLNGYYSALANGYSNNAAEAFGLIELIHDWGNESPGSSPNDEVWANVHECIMDDNGIVICWSSRSNPVPENPRNNHTYVILKSHELEDDLVKLLKMSGFDVAAGETWYLLQDPVATKFEEELFKKSLDPIWTEIERNSAYNQKGFEYLQDLKTRCRPSNGRFWVRCCQITSDFNSFDCCKIVEKDHLNITTIFQNIPSSLEPHPEIQFEFEFTLDEPQNVKIAMHQLDPRFLGRLQHYKFEIDFFLTNCNGTEQFTMMKGVLRKDSEWQDLDKGTYKVILGVNSSPNPKALRISDIHYRYREIAKPWLAALLQRRDAVWSQGFDDIKGQRKIYLKQKESLIKDVKNESGSLTTGQGTRWRKIDGERIYSRFDLGPMVPIRFELITTVSNAKVNGKFPINYRRPLRGEAAQEDKDSGYEGSARKESSSGSTTDFQQNSGDDWRSPPSRADIRETDIEKQKPDKESESVTDLAGLGGDDKKRPSSPTNIHEDHKRSRLDDEKSEADTILAEVAILKDIVVRNP